MTAEGEPLDTIETHLLLPRFWCDLFCVRCARFRPRVNRDWRQLPYDLGVAEANAALYAILGKPVPPYVSIQRLALSRTTAVCLGDGSKVKPTPAVN